MSQPTPGAPHLDVAGWLLGALDANEAAAFEAHLASCSECQAEVERLRPTVTLLSTAAQDVEVPPLLADRTVAAVRDTARRRRRRNWTVRALVAAAVGGAAEPGRRRAVHPIECRDVRFRDVQSQRWPGEPGRRMRITRAVAGASSCPCTVCPH